MKVAEILEQYLSELTRRGFLKGVAALGAAAVANKAAAVLPDAPKINLDAMAFKAVEMIKQQPNWEKYEYIVLILDSGKLTRPHTDKHSDHVRVPVPNSGAKILAMVHNHPRANDRGSRIAREETFSPADRQEAKRHKIPTYVLGHDDVLRVWKEGDLPEGNVVDIKHVNESVDAVHRAPSVKFGMEPEWGPESRRHKPTGEPNSVVEKELAVFNKGKIKAREFSAYDSDGKLAGVLSVVVKGDGKGAFKITVRPDARRKGIGSKLLDAAKTAGVEINYAANRYTSDGRALTVNWLSKQKA